MNMGWHRTHMRILSVFHLPGVAITNVQTSRPHQPLFYPQLDISQSFRFHLLIPLPTPNPLVMSTEAPKGKGPERERRPIPLTVLSIICRYLQLDNAQDTLLSVLLTSRNSYEVTIPHLYKDVYITEEGLGSLVKGLHRQEDKPFDRWPIGDELFLGYSPSDPPINQAQRRARMQKYYTDMLKDYVSVYQVA